MDGSTGMGFRQFHDFFKQAMKSFHNETKRQDSLVNSSSLTSRRNLVIGFLGTSGFCLLMDFGALFTCFYSVDGEGATAVRLLIAIFFFMVDLKLLSTLSQPSQYFNVNRTWT
jgi:hypothetical protein